MKRRILVVGPILRTFGGVSRFLGDLLDSGMDYDFVHFNTARPPKNLSAPTAVVGYSELFNAGLVRSILGILITIWHVLKFPFILLHESPDIVHITTVTYWVFWESATYIIISKLMGYKVILHMLGPFDVFYQKSGKGIRFLVHAVLRKADRVICLSNRDKDLMSAFLPGDISILRSNVQLPFDKLIYPDRQGRKRVEALFIGGIDPFRKGINDILKALPIVVKEYDEIRFTFSGGLNVQQAISESLDPQFSHWVTYRGWVSETEKWELYQSSDILLLPSYEEGLPYVLIEAMAYGLPIITTPVGGIPDVIREAKNGFLINPGDYRDLADRIVKLAQNENLRITIGRTNQEEVKNYYLQEAIFKELDGIYNDLISN